MSTLKQMRAEKAQKSEDLAKIFDSVQDLSELSSDQKEEIKKRNSLKDEMENSKKVSGMPVYGEPELDEPKSLGQQFLDSDAYKSFVDHGIKNIPFEAKTTVTTSVWTRDTIYQQVIPAIEPDPNPVLDLVDSINTDQTTYYYLREVATNNAAETAEGSAAPEDAFTYTAVTAPVAKFITTLPITAELLEDQAGARAYFDGRLANHVLQRLEKEFIGGDGASPNIQGILGTTNVNQIIYSAGTYPSSVGGKLRAILEGIKDIEENGKLFPDAMVMSPGAYEALAGQVDGNENFMLGAAAQSGSPTIWGVPVVKSTQIGSAVGQDSDVLIGKFGGGMAANHVFRRGMELQISDSAADGDFGKDILTVKASLRYASAIYKPQGFTKVQDIE